MKLVRHVGLAVGAVAVIAAAGCTVHGSTRPAPPVGYVEVTSAPVVDYRHYPHTSYDGRVVYFVDGRWGYPRGREWVYYRTEPPPLARYRTTVQTAPPAPPPVPRTHVPGPYYPGSQPPPATAPPATRTR